MNEGEFKKRITKSWMPIRKIPTFVLIDDARNEWLEIEECELPIKTNGTVDWQKTAELMELRNIIRNRWFEKWFGK